MKKSNSYLVVFLVCLMTLFSPVTVTGQVHYSDPTKNQEVDQQLFFLEDPEDTLSIEDIAVSEDFRQVTRKVHNFGITSAAIWFRLPIHNTCGISNIVLQVNQPLIDELDLYRYDHRSQQFVKTSVGEYKPFDQRVYQTPQYLFDLKIPNDSTYYYYLKVKCKENMQVPMSIGTRISVVNSTLLSNLASGIYIGIMVVMMLYNLFIYTTVRDRNYLLYSLYIVIVLLTQTSVQGYTFQFLWPDKPQLSVYSQFFFPSLAGLSGLAFFNGFLRIRERMPFAWRASFLFLIPYTVGPAISLFGFYGLSFKIVEGTALCISLFMMSMAVVVFRKGFTEARFFLIGWSVFLLGVMIYVLKDFELLEYNNFTRYTMHFGSAVEVVLLSFALAERINILKKEKDVSQAEALAVLQQNQKLIADQNTMLEQKVHERTLELEEINEELNVTLSYLKDTQAQLVDAEKMASLGQLTAGIAHEINNPINFVSANIRPLRMDIDDLTELIKKYETLNPDNYKDRIGDIQNFRKQIDVDYVRTEIDTLLAGIEDGARRTTEIVSGLKNFSRLDESDIKVANINEGIESTLVLLKSAIPENVEVVTRFGHIPPIECLPGKLNQVFMNLLSNALYAMEKHRMVGRHRLTISTYAENGHIYVRISDTGIGMTPEVKSRIFEPFFTTKDVGEGTGLGMSIVFKIVESHHARLEIDTTEGKGTTMTLVLNEKMND